MRTLRLMTALLILLIPTAVDAQRPNTKAASSYSTRFQRDEDPISEGGKWINGGKDGIDWYNVITKNGAAYGAVTQGEYTDPTALLAGTWGKNQKVKAKVFSRNQTEKYYQEVEIRLRSTIKPHVCTGYEVFWRCLKTKSAYAEIVRWNGKSVIGLRFKNTPVLSTGSRTGIWWGRPSLATSSRDSSTA